MVILITGKSGSGKTFIAENLAIFFDAEVISFDKISKQIMKNPDIISLIKTHFGNEIAENNTINSKKLGKIVFSDEEKLNLLNNIVQSKMEELIDKILKQNKNFIIEYALLPKMKYFNSCDYKILVKATNQIRKTRILNRDNISEEYFNLRENNSLEYDEKKYDLVLENNGNLNFKQLANNIKEKIC